MFYFDLTLTSLDKPIITVAISALLGACSTDRPQLYNT